MHRGVIGTLGLEEYVSSGQVICAGFEQVELVKEKEKHRLSSEYLKMVETIWREHLKIKPDDYNGCVGSIVSLAWSGKKLVVRFREASFAEFYATQSRRPEVLDVKSECLDQEFCLPLSFGAVAVTKPSVLCPNGCIVFAERGKTAFDEGKLTLLPGGYFDPEKDYFQGEKGNIYSIIFTILRELFEELEVSGCESIDFLGLVYNNQGSRQPLLVVSLQLPFTAEEMKKVKRETKEEEVRRIFFVKNDISAV
jgi:hypothetical protein